MKKLKMKATRGLTFEEGCNKYLEYCRQRNLRQGTINHYRQSYVQFFKFFTPDTPIEEIDEDAYKRYVLYLRSIVSELTEKGVEFVSLKESIDTTTPQGRFMLTIFGALAELERESILERQREGIEIAKSEGKYKGRKPVDIDEEKFVAVCKKWRDGKMTATAAINELGLKPNTFYRRVKEMNL